MREKLSKRLMGFARSATLVMFQRSSELAARGVDVINLGVGEPDFDTPEYIREAAHSAIEEGWTRYAPVPGLLSLREAICAKLRRENGLEYAPSEIVVSNGAKQCLCNAILSLIDPGDEVIIPAPYWVSYPQMVRIAEGEPVLVPSDISSGFKISPGQLEAAITPRTRMLILCSPSNPSGAVYSRSELEALSQVLLQHPDVMVLADEIYEHIIYSGTACSMASLPGMRERTLVVNGVSKAYAMTGWRIGYLAGPKWVADACAKLQGQYTSGASSVSQKAAEAALRGPQECVETMRQSFERRRDLLVRLLQEVPGVGISVPDGAFYLLPDFSAYFGKRSAGGKLIADASDLAIYLLEEAHVATVAGDPFGAPGCLRLSYATSEQALTEAVSRIRAALGQLS